MKKNLFTILLAIIWIIAFFAMCICGLMHKLIGLNIKWLIISAIVFISSLCMDLKVNHSHDDNY